MLVTLIAKDLVVLQQLRKGGDQLSVALGARAILVIKL